MVALRQDRNVKRLQKVIDEHNNVRKSIKESQEFLNVVKENADQLKLNDSELPFIVYQFQTFYKVVTKLQNNITYLQ